MSLRQTIIDELHAVHPGIVKMKTLARGYVYWPGIDHDLEERVRNCDICQSNRKQPPKAELHPWEYPHKPWSRLHVDFCGPFMGVNILIIVDATTKWIDAYIMKSIAAKPTIEKLISSFSKFGIPDQIVSDNGPTFRSEEFGNFLRRNGVRQTFVAPYHPSSNGLAERAVQVVKQGLRKLRDCGQSIENKLNIVLFQHRTIPHSTTGITPSESLFGRKIQTKLDLLRPSNKIKVQRSQDNQIKNYVGNKTRVFEPGQEVMIIHGSKKVRGVVLEKTGQLSYRVKIFGGGIMAKHVDHMWEAPFHNEIEEESITDKTCDAMDNTPKFNRDLTLGVNNDASLALDNEQRDQELRLDEPMVPQALGCKTEEPNTNLNTNSNMKTTDTYLSPTINARTDSGDKDNQTFNRPKRNTRPPSYLNDYVTGK